MPDGSIAPTPTDMPRLPLRGFLWDIALNAGIPLLLYRLAKRYVSTSEVVALMIAATFPLAKSTFELVRRRRLDPVAVIVLLGLAVSGVGVLMGGSARLLLIRESLFTGALGLACFGSLLLPRPLMFYFGRHFLAGDDPVARAEFDASWERPAVRSVHRLITVVWGSAFLGEFAIRVALVYTLPAAAVLVLSPVLLGVITIGTFIWTFAYVRRVRRRTAAAGREATASPGIFTKGP
jgi:hypothetical protein